MAFPATARRRNYAESHRKTAALVPVRLERPQLHVRGAGGLLSRDTLIAA
jgi:hypothetical protein